MTDSRATVAEYERQVQAARNALIECAVIAADRNSRIRHAAALGVQRTDIAELAGLSRAQVHTILRKSR